MAFTLHYRAPPRRPDGPGLGAAQLAAAAAACPARVHAPEPRPPPPPKPKATGPPAAQAAAWNRIARLDWALRSDRALSWADAEARVAAAGGPAAVCGAFRLLSEAATAAHPTLAALGDGARWQLLALGQDTANAAGRSPDLLAYLVTEAQAFDLLQLLAP